MKKTITLSLLAGALLSQLHADNAYTLETVNVTAAQGTTLNKKDVTDSVTVITKEDIEESRVSTLNEALNKLGGLFMTQNGGPGTSSSFFMRGMSSKRVLVLIDGVRYNNPTAIGAAAEFSQILLNNVERIEIIKGAQSGVWGADASGGVINIITSKAKKGLHGTTTVEYGSYDSKKASAVASYATKKFDISISGITYYVDGFSAAEPKKSEANYGKRYDELGLEKDSYKNNSLNAKLGYNITDIDRVEFNLQAINSLVNYDSGAGETNDSPIPNTYLQNRFYTIDYKHNGNTNKVNFQYNLSKFDRDTTYGDYVGDVNELKLDDKITYMKNSFLRVGTSYQKFTHKDITPNTTKDYSALSAFVTNYNKLNLLADTNTIITESVRYDSYDNFDNSLTGKFGVKQFIKNDLYISANIGTGYNAPTLGQLYGLYGPNPNLKPEKSLTSDITLGNDTLWITGFYNEITDLIDYDGSYVQIDGKSKFKGLEIGYNDYFLDSLGVNALYTYVRTEDASGKTLARRPLNQFNASATYYISDDFDIGANIEYIGKRYDSAGNQGAKTGSYAVSGLVVNVQANKNVKFYTKINNLTDRYYQTVDGYATAGRSVYVGLVAKY
jgi:vitamin B12 transporter